LPSLVRRAARRQVYAACVKTWLLRRSRTMGENGPASFETRVPRLLRNEELYFNQVFFQIVLNRPPAPPSLKEVLRKEIDAHRRADAQPADCNAATSSNRLIQVKADPKEVGPRRSAPARRRPTMMRRLVQRHRGHPAASDTVEEASGRVIISTFTYVAGAILGAMPT